MEWKADMYCAALFNGVWERAQICSDVTSSDSAEVKQVLLPKNTIKLFSFNPRVKWHWKSVLHVNNLFFLIQQTACWQRCISFAVEYNSNCSLILSDNKDLLIFLIYLFFNGKVVGLLWFTLLCMTFSVTSKGAKWGQTIDS